jgi:hypothetical protein
MCLYEIDKKIKKASFGWKVFDKSEQYPDYEYVAPDLFYYGQSVNRNVKFIASNLLLPTEQWIEDKVKGKLFADTSGYYPTGFHVFKSYKQAKGWKEPHQIICKVLMEDIVASGAQWVIAKIPAIVFVAKRIYIEKPK